MAKQLIKLTRFQRVDRLFKATEKIGADRFRRAMGYVQPPGCSREVAVVVTSYAVLVYGARAQADALQVFDAVDQDSWWTPTVKNAPSITYSMARGVVARLPMDPIAGTREGVTGREEPHAQCRADFVARVQDVINACERELPHAKQAYAKARKDGSKTDALIARTALDQLTVNLRAAKRRLKTLDGADAHGLVLPLEVKQVKEAGRRVGVDLRSIRAVLAATGAKQGTMHGRAALVPVEFSMETPEGPAVAFLSPFRT